MRGRPVSPARRPRPDRKPGRPRRPTGPLLHNIYIDDSGSGGVLWDWTGNKKDQGKAPPVVNVAALVIDETAEPLFAEAWTALRRSIADELGETDLPTIHMRLMYPDDERLPKTFRKKPNPYAKATRERRLAWIGDASRILTQFGREGALFAMGVGTGKDAIAESWRGYYTSREFLDDYAFLRRKNLHALRRFHNVACNPHLTMLTQLVFGLDRTFQRQVQGDGTIVYDRNPLSKGFDVCTAVERLQHIGLLTRLKGQRESDDESSPMLQAADVVANRDHKVRVGRHQVAAGNPDPTEPIVHEWSREFPIPFGGSPLGLPRKERIYASVVHYELARMTAADEDPEFVDRHLVTVEEFMDRAYEGARLRLEGVSVRK